MKHIALLALFGFLASVAGAQLPPAPAGDPANPDTVIEFGEPEPVTVETDDGFVSFSALIADSDPERQRGLMFREALADDEAMLFDYETVQPASIWMRNTLISLDIIFIAEDGRIVKIVANAQPLTLRSNESDFPILGVLEVRGGLARDVGIRPGDIVRHRIFGNTEPEQGPVVDGATDDESAGDAAEDTDEDG
ncbi:DUF192 domain-containing protein [Hyphobacterium sp. HN65]|uniref:DUF192 domain-containing protein n=1 Tax=Hyphobacterium lacteum TaxID=3116575 RepID=A0ABU7LM53_9PROT|nr:DUF192 domain-containing protein [Hyphobacterium sp. HN65]MEE2524996.1 DUF192 domain-containing protein [Hyphobacterium sp. HN65]